MITYLIANQKGGVGKTTTATSIASILQKKGYKVLLIDADVQGNSSDTYRAKIDGEATLYDVLLEEEADRVPIKDAIQHTKSGDIVPSDPLLRRADEILKNDVDGLYRMKDALDELDGYDYVVIDTNPSINALLHSALVASDEVIIPVTADRYAIQGFSQLLDTIYVVRKHQNKNLKIAGLLMVVYNPTLNISKDTVASLEAVSDRIGVGLFDTRIRQCVKVKESQDKRKTLIEYAANSTAAKDYEAFVNELTGKE